MGTFHQRKFQGCRFDYFIMIRSRDSAFPLSLVSGLFESCTAKFFHVTGLCGYTVII